MTPTATLTSSAAAKSSVKPLVQFQDAKPIGNDEFSPMKHLDFKSPVKTYTMKDLNLPEGTGVSPFAVSEPFSLFTPEAVHRMRAEVLSNEVMENCQYSSNLAQCQLRGFAAQLVGLMCYP